MTPPDRRARGRPDPGESGRRPIPQGEESRLPVDERRPGQHRAHRSLSSEVAAAIDQHTVIVSVTAAAPIMCHGTACGAAS
ncbi:hypothetical protein OHA77_16180 [Streptosporangium sp. NBC_01639]|uniref:hypothetical protein n=1 Tax=Streptosporangium sp. NBC_01639 TaxID=2975948 RepID=UPI003868CEF9|nr:hypothetical protein OHA77_16180 [Streptosporangium sp. NBC_01639]